MTLMALMPDTSAATFLQVLNNCHSSVKFTMETVSNGMLPWYAATEQSPSNRDQGLHKTYEPLPLPLPEQC